MSNYSRNNDDNDPRSTTRSRDQALSPMTVSPRMKPNRASKIKLFRNGDPFFAGRSIVLKKQALRKGTSIDHVMDVMSEEMKSFGAVRKIYTSQGGTRVQSVDQIRDGKSYVIARGEGFKQMDYGSITTLREREAQHNKVLENNPRDFNRRFQRRKSTSPTKLVSGSAMRSTFSDVKAKNVVFFRNADVTQRHFRIMLTKRNTMTWDQVCQMLSDRLRMTSAVRKVYTTDGKQIKNVNEFEDGGNYVAVGRIGFKAQAFTPVEKANLAPPSRKALPPITKAKVRMRPRPPPPQQSPQQKQQQQQQQQQQRRHVNNKAPLAPIGKAHKVVDERVPSPTPKPQSYLVKVFTGAGDGDDKHTVGDVFITIHGINGSSRREKLRKRNAFRPDSSDVFVVESVSIGDIVKIQVEVVATNANNNNTTALWNLEKITVRDTVMDVMMHFHFTQWSPSVYSGAHQVEMKATTDPNPVQQKHDDSQDDEQAQNEVDHDQNDDDHDQSNEEHDQHEERDHDLEYQIERQVSRYENENRENEMISPATVVEDSEETRVDETFDKRPVEEVASPEYFDRDDDDDDENVRNNIVLEDAPTQPSEENIVADTSLFNEHEQQEHRQSEQQREEEEEQQQQQQQQQQTDLQQALQDATPTQQQQPQEFVDESTQDHEQHHNHNHQQEDQEQDQQHQEQDQEQDQEEVVDDDQVGTAHIPTETVVSDNDVRTNATPITETNDTHDEQKANNKAIVDGDGVDGVTQEQDNVVVQSNVVDKDEVVVNRDDVGNTSTTSDKEWTETTKMSEPPKQEDSVDCPQDDNDNTQPEQSSPPPSLPHCTDETPTPLESTPPQVAETTDTAPHDEETAIIGAQENTEDTEASQNIKVAEMNATDTVEQTTTTDAEPLETTNNTETPIQLENPTPTDTQESTETQANTATQENTVTDTNVAQIEAPIETPLHVDENTPVDTTENADNCSTQDKQDTNTTETETTTSEAQENIDTTETPAQVEDNGKATTDAPTSNEATTEPPTQQQTIDTDAQGNTEDTSGTEAPTTEP